MNLPNDFLLRMQEMLGEEYTEFLKSYENERASGLRVNTLKITAEELAEKLGKELEKIPWTRNGFFYGGDFRPGKLPLHDAGAYYIQEPSAMAAAELVNAQPGEKILDLCAAPGGKSTSVAADMAGEGLLIANEIVPSRAKILSGNIERMGIKNAVVLNESPAALSKKFIGFFDKIIVDAPCSGEGMFRKDEEAVRQWSAENVGMCAERQAEILDSAAKMLRGGGRIIYSTCTFAPAENEQTVVNFLTRHDDFTVVDCGEISGLSRGNPEWAGGDERAAHTYRFWPHLSDGEGHFMAVLEKSGESAGAGALANTKCDKTMLEYYRKFESEFLTKRLEGNFSSFGDNLYLTPDGMPDIAGLRALRFGLHLGVMKKNRFEPSHSLAMSLKGGAKNILSLDYDSPEAGAYLRGETLPCEVSGWTLVEISGCSAGWGKASGGVLKNHYPKGLRRNF